MRGQRDQSLYGFALADVGESIHLELAREQIANLLGARGGLV